MLYSRTKSSFTAKRDRGADEARKFALDGNNEMVYNSFRGFM